MKNINIISRVHDDLNADFFWLWDNYHSHWYGIKSNTKDNILYRVKALLWGAIK